MADRSPRRRPHPVTGGGIVALEAALVVVLCASLVIGVSWGTVTLPIGEVWSVIGSHLGWSDTTPTPVQNQIIWEFRTPRVLLATVPHGEHDVVLPELVTQPLVDVHQGELSPRDHPHDVAARADG